VIQHIVVVGLVVFISTFMLYQPGLDGPWGIFLHIRRWAMEQAFDVPDEAYPVRPFFYALWDCFWCLGTWMSAFITIAYVIGLQLPAMYLFFIWLGAIAVAGIINKFVMM